MGGRASITALSSFRVSATGERLMTFQGYHPDDDAGPNSSFTSEIDADLAGERLRVAYRRMIPVFGATTDYRFVVQGNLAAAEGVESAFGAPAGALPSDRVAATRRLLRLLHPQVLLRDVARGARTATAAGVALRDGELRDRLEISDEVRPLTLYLDRQTGEVTELATVENDYVTGDTALEAHYAGWRSWDDTGVRYPSEVVIALAGQPVHTERRSAVATNLAFEDARFAFPAGTTPQFVAADAARGARNSQFHEGFGALGVPLDGPQSAIAAQQIAPGVHHLRGGSHHTLVVEQAAGVVVFEAPLYEARAKAIYAWIASAIPGKPVTHLVLTHHHRDHAGALRTFVARGARVVVGEAAVPHYTRALAAARSLDPDELAQAPRTAAIDAVRATSELTIPDAARPVRVVPVASTHAVDMVMAYVPSASTVFVSDIYSPGLPGSPAGAREVLAAITARNLSVTTVAGGHGAVGTRAQLDQAAGQ
jgi:glyoxylase-like metal-dependent hydrolase (beta-lactamase superfamily II)